MSHQQNPQFDYSLISPDKLKPKPKADEKIAFGRVRTDYMFNSEYRDAHGGWQKGKLEPLKDFTFRADSVVFHYGQQIFEGMKAYRSVVDQESILLFRPDQNAKRFARSAELMGMESVPEELFMAAVKSIVALEKDWIFQSPGALYIRPMLLPLDDGIYARPSADYRFSVLVSPVQEYFVGGAGVLLAVDRVRTRACPGGVGEAKCGGNYAASMHSLEAAKAKGADQVLFLDGAEHRYIEEASAMNIFFVYGDKLVTPKLSGSILRGVTRDSIIQLAKARGLSVEESRLEIDQIISDMKSGTLTECFLCGTAAVITPVRAFLDRDKEVEISKESFGKLSMSLREELVSIQTGKKQGPSGWIQTC